MLHTDVPLLSKLPFTRETDRIMTIMYRLYLDLSYSQQ